MTSRSEGGIVDVPRLLRALGIDYRDHYGELWARCPHPSHDEKTASWSIKDDPESPSNGGHHCFGCKWQGGPIELVMQVVGFSGYGAARRYIETRGLFVDRGLPSKVVVKVRDARAAAMELAAVKQTALDRWPTPARRYAQSRGITAAQVEKWRLGYASGGYYANRIVFPVYSKEGDLLNATGRKFTDADGPKYKSAPHQVADQSAVFGEEWWPDDCSALEVVVSEGAINALACERVGALNVAALYDSDLDKGQLMKLVKFARIIVATDNDKAGRKVASGLRSALARHREVTVADFPPKVDACDLERTDPGMLKRVLWGNART